MPRQARNHSATGIYHVMLRGIDKRLIFMDDEDKRKFMKGLAKAKEIAGFMLYGYCLMDNHVHLLMKEKEELGISIKRITVGYVQWHNNKYGRTGHLFSNRYLSEPVESENYMFTALRYIHQNPVKAGIVKRIKDYPWSSYCDYITGSSNDDAPIDPDLVLSCFVTLDSFISYMNESSNAECLEYKSILKYTDMQLRNWIENRYNIEAMLTASVTTMAKEIMEIYKETGASVRQLSRVLGIGKTTVGKAVRVDRGSVPVSTPVAIPSAKP